MKTVLELSKEFACDVIETSKVYEFFEDPDSIFSIDFIPDYTRDTYFDSEDLIYLVPAGEDSIWKLTNPKINKTILYEGRTYSEDGSSVEVKVERFHSAKNGKEGFLVTSISSDSDSSYFILDKNCRDLVDILNVNLVNLLMDTDNADHAEVLSLFHDEIVKLFK